MAHTMWWRGTPPGRRHQVVWRPWPTNRPPPSHTCSPRKPKTGGGIERYSAAATRRKPEREKALRQGEICRGNSLPEGEDRRLLDPSAGDALLALIGRVVPPASLL